MVKWYIIGVIFGMVCMAFISNAMATTVNEVWVVEYDRPDFSDCNGVFAEMEDALDSVERDFERCSDIWHDIEMRDDEEDYKSWNFVIWCDDDQQYEEINVRMYLTEIQ